MTIPDTRPDTQSARKQLAKLVDLRALPKWRARVEIARDVLAGLDVGALRAERNTYFQANQSSARAPSIAGRSGDDLQRLLAAGVLYNCRVCAIGGMLLAKVGRLDNYAPHIDYYNDSGICATRVDCDEQLSEFFAAAQMSAIECAFECSIAFGDDVISSGKARKAVDFGARFEDADSRMRAIMQNIIDNKGTFVP